MKRQAFNPFLPSYEYVPDGEPHMFNERIYIYGSHDRFNGIIFCMNDYTCWSAPVNDLSDWRCEGIIYKKKQDPLNRLGVHLLFAPDVVRGLDGRYYLYYAFDFFGVMGVAVSDSPAGGYEFYDHVHFNDGRLWGRRSGDSFPFDPGVFIDDDSRIYLYSGFALSIPRIVTGLKKLTSEGGVVIELEKDMVTIKGDPKLLFPSKGGNAFKGHTFFEASSIRKIDNRYYFIYSSEHNHELCYAFSDSPIEGFTFGGTLISIGDLFKDGNKDEGKGLNYLGNTHGGIVNIDNIWYIFYHRHTNRHSYSRQVCAEPLEMTETGIFKQAEITSCGLNRGPLTGRGVYEARIACNLWSKDGVTRYDCFFSRIRNAKHPYFTQDGRDRERNSNQYIANMHDGAVAGYKYFQISELNEIEIEIRGKAQGKMIVSTSSSFDTVISVVSIDIRSNKKWVSIKASCHIREGRKALYFKFIGNGKIDFMSFELI